MEIKYLQSGVLSYKKEKKRLRKGLRESVSAEYGSYLITEGYAALAAKPTNVPVPVPLDVPGAETVDTLKLESEQKADQSPTVKRNRKRAASGGDN